MLTKMRGILKCIKEIGKTYLSVLYENRERRERRHNGPLMGRESYQIEPNTLRSTTMLFIIRSLFDLSSLFILAHLVNL